MAGSKKKGRKLPAKEISFKTSTKKVVANVNKSPLPNVRKLRSGNISPNSPKEVPVASKASKRKSTGYVAFDEITCPQPTSSKRSRGGKHAAPEPNLISQQVENSSKKTGTPLLALRGKQMTAVEEKIPQIQAQFTEGGQEMQMAINDVDDELFTTESSGDECDECDSNAETTPDEQRDSSGAESDGSEESRTEEGHLDKDEQQCERQTHGNVRSSGQQAPASSQIEDIDREMQRRIIDLHDKLEESGLSRSVNLIEQLFNQKPGDDKVTKSKLKKRLRTGIGRATGSSNKNDNRTTAKENFNIPVLNDSSQNLSEVTVYQNVVQKCNSSSSEDDGLDLSDESNLMNRLLLGDKVETEVNKRSETEQKPQPSTSG